MCDRHSKGVLPLQFKKGEDITTLGLNGTETFSITGIDSIKPRSEIDVKATREDKIINFKVIVRVDSEVDIEYYQNGGILNTVLRNILKNK